jgi:hypothetical protein
MVIVTQLAQLTIIAASATLMAIGIPALASAAPVSQSDYLAFNASARDRAKGEKRFSQVMQVSYGDRNLVKSYFGKRGPTPSQRISLTSETGSISFRGKGNQNVLSLDINPRARTGSDLLVVVVDGAQCRVGNERPEPCQAEIRVIKGRGGISNRIVASGSNGAAYDSGSKDVMAGYLTLTDTISN